MAFATSTPDAAAAKQQITARGVGKSAKVYETGGTVLRGKILSIGEVSFQMQNGSHQPVEVPFADVRRVENAGLSSGAKLAIWVSAGVLIVIVVVGAAYAHAVSGLQG